MPKSGRSHNGGKRIATNEAAVEGINRRSHLILLQEFIKGTQLDSPAQRDTLFSDWAWTPKVLAPLI